MVYFIIQLSKFKREKLKREISIFYERRRHISAERLSWAETNCKLRAASKNVVIVWKLFIR